MKLAGKISIIVGCILFAIAIGTITIKLFNASDSLNRSGAETKAIEAGEEVVKTGSDPVSWQVEGVEVVVGFAFLIPGIALVKHVAH